MLGVYTTIKFIFFVTLGVAWTADVSFQTGLKPATIFASSTKAKEGENVSLKCSVRDANSAVKLNVYLCKNGVGDRMEKLTDGEASFTLTNVTLQDTGNYSCVYTHRKLKYSEVYSTGEYSIFIRIKSSPVTIPDLTRDQLNSDSHNWRVNVVRMVLSVVVLIGIIMLVASHFSQVQD